MKEERKRQKTTNGNSDLSRSKEDQGFGQLVTELRGLIQSARHAAATTVNTLQVLTNFEIGRRIVEHEQKGAERAEYGKELLKGLSVRLSEEFGNGFSPTNLKLMRQFFVEYRDRIGQSQSDLFPHLPIGQSVTDQLRKIVQSPSSQLAVSEKPSRKPPFTLSKWVETQDFASLQRRQ